MKLLNCLTFTSLSIYIRPYPIALFNILSGGVALY